PRGGFMKAGVDIVRARLGAAHTHAASRHRPQQADGHAGLARAGAGRADQDGACGHAGLSIFSRSATMWPTTMRAGEETFSRAANATSVTRVATMVSSGGRVAFSINAPGVSPGRPPDMRSDTVSAIWVKRK